MRTAIYLGLYVLAEATYGGELAFHSEDITKFLAIILVILMIMDIVDFVREEG